ncbi:carboxypeptidase-like regulatory domain-containing protein [Carboxylicivirga sp. N1Y90]|uniref:carboxypeptidase-like regulatory domain-containing protein n=1 Tax=Carboxylicivirga fragile TaxID=3417571 RepID=UPI003D330ACC|nr:carboxypeptidase-like regulatory domain-containing protein [Marinilabiliaceae bacterium N1Y90]
MRPLIFCLLLFTTNTILLSQTEISGKVIDEIGDAIPFATISLNGKTQGTIANQNGLFYFSCKTEEADTIQISCIGYESVILPISKDNSNQTITLNKKSYEIPDITITRVQRKLKRIKDNKRARCSIRSHLGTQIVTFIELPKGSTLNDVTFYCKRSLNTPIVGVQVYSMNHKMEPKESLLTENYTTEISRWSSKVHFDLKKYNITCSKHGLFVGIVFMGEPNEDPKKQNKANPYLYLSSRTQKAITYFKSYHLSFIQQNFPDTKHRFLNLECSYSYYE